MKRAVLFVFAFCHRLAARALRARPEGPGAEPGDRRFEDDGVGSGRGRRQRRDLGSELQEPGRHADARLAAERRTERAAARRHAAVAGGAAGPRSGASNARTKLSLSRSQSSLQGVVPMLKHIVLAAFLTGGAAAAYAQPQQAASARPPSRRRRSEDGQFEDGAFGHCRHPQADRPQHQERRRRDDRRDQVDLHQQGRQGRQRHGERRRLPGRRRPRGPHRLVRSQDHRQRREGHGQHDQGRTQGQAGVQVQERDVARPGLHRHRPVDGAAERHRACGRRAAAGQRPARPDDQAAGRPLDRQAG